MWRASVNNAIVWFLVGLYIAIDDKQTALVAIGSRMLAKHLLIVLPDVETKFNISANFQLQKYIP